MQLREGVSSFIKFFNMTTIASSGFFTQVLGEVSHPINIVREYLEAFGNKCKAAIITWLDSWTRTKIAQGKDIWVWERQRNLAKELGYNKDTINIHLNKLIDDGFIEASLQTPNSCSRLLKYRLNIDNLSVFLDQHGFSPLNRNSVHGKTDSRTIEDGNPDSNLIHSLNSNNPKSNELINNSDVVEAVTLSNLEELREEKPINTHFVDNKNQDLSVKPITPHEDQEFRPAPRPVKAQPQQEIIDPDVSVKQKMIEGMGMVFNPRLKGILANFTIEQIIKGIASYLHTTECLGRTPENRTGFIIDAIKNSYIENTEKWINASEEGKKLIMFFAAGTAWGIESLRSFEATIALGEYLYHEEFRFEIEYCDRRKDEMGWEYVLDGMKQTQDSKNNE